mgnify:FL=1
MGERMALKDLHDFLVALSKHPSLRRSFAADADTIGSEANLTPKEIELLNTGSEAEIRDYLGEKYASASMIKVKP